jgi:molybdate transport system substrate-binding protein
MKWLADSRGRNELGITQITEILANKGVTYAGSLPGDLQAKTVYSAGLSVRAMQAAAGREFIARLTSPAARGVLVQAGYEFDN